MRPPPSSSARLAPHALICRCPTVDDALLWEWLAGAERHRVDSTELSEDCLARRTVVVFENEVDAHRFRRWAQGRGFGVEGIDRNRDEEGRQQEQNQ